jgi:uncharacterized protein
MRELIPSVRSTFRRKVQVFTRGTRNFPLDKLTKLKNILSKIESCLIAYSGGVDSTFLLRIASEVLPKDKLLAVTADSETYPKEELIFARRIAKALNVRHKVIRTNEIEDKRFTSNPQNRCYFCKRELFTKLKSIAKKAKLNFVADASNISDKTDFRPGSIARKELKIRSPLAEAGLTKEEIRSLSKSLGLVTWDKPSLACLASRIPYGTAITPDILSRVNQAETILRKMGFDQVRLRHYNGLCRIEVMKNEIPKLLTRSNQIVDKLKKLGYNFITIDLEGYRTGSLNEVIKK